MTKKQATKKGSGSFEQLLKRLEKIVETLEQGNVPLDEALKMYEEGVILSRQCMDKLNQAELKLKRLTKDVNGNFELLEESEIE